MPTTRPTAAAWIALAAALLAGACSLWVVFEQDIYWQIRAGDELWATHVFPTVDTWSYSARGQPWLNVQWLSTLVLRGVYALGQEPALVVGRAVVVAAWLLLLAWGWVRATRQAAHLHSVGVAVLLPLAYVALWPRLQLRSDTLVMGVFAGLVALWASPVAPGPAWIRRAWWTLGAVVLAANLHAGTAPFVVVAAVTLLVASRMAWRVWPWCAAMVGGFFCTPYGPKVLPLLWAHVFYYDHNVLQNSDQQPLSWAYMAGLGNGWAGYAWGALMLLTLGAWGMAAWRGRRWQWAWVPTGLCMLLLTGLSINRVRAIPYQIMFMLPLMGRAAAQAWAPRTGRAPATWPLWLLTPASTGLAAACVWSLHTLWGFGVHERLFPVGSTQFVERAQPARNILHTFACGAYMVWHLRDYPLYVDTRETMYWPLQAEVLGAYHSAEITQAMIRKYDVNTVLMPIPATRYIQNLGFEDVIASYLPSHDWALVYFDKITFVMVRRIPEHMQLIAQHEYTLLHPNLPANAYPLSTGRTPGRDAVFVRELQRCLADEPESVYCLVAQAAWWRATDAVARAGDAIALLERAQAQAERWGSMQTLTLLVELQAAYELAGLKNRAEAVARQLSGGTVMPMQSEAP